MAERKGKIFEANSFPESKEIKHFDTVSDHDYKHGSTSLKSEISTEIGLPLSNGSFVMNAKKTSGNVNTTETHNSPHRTESSCSNSFSIIPPVSLSNHSFQDTSKEAYSCRNYTGSTDSSNSKGFDRRSEEPVTASSESGVSIQIARKAISNARAKNSIKISSMAGRHSSSLTKNGDKEKLRSFDEHDNSDDFNCSIKIEENVRSCDEHDNHPTSHSGERMISSEISEESENILPVKGKNEGIFLGNESSESSMMKPVRVSKKDEDTFIAGFDLNEDISGNGMDEFIQPIVPSIPSHNVIHVVARAGVPRGPPTKPLKFEGAQGWKGSSETTAFRPTSFYKSLHKKISSRNHSPKYQGGFKGIDLNVAAVEDERISSPSIFQDSPSQIDSKRTKRPSIDLNRLYDADDDFTQPNLEKTRLLDLNVNVNTSIGDASNNFHRQGQDSAIPKQDFHFARHDYLAGLSTMQHLANNAHPQQYFVASPNIFQPLQPKLPFLPPHNYPYKGSVPFGTRGPLPLYSHENGIFHGIMNPGMGPASLGTPYFVQAVNGQSSSNITASMPKLDIKTEENFERMQREAWYATSMKRKEPEVGLEHTSGATDRVKENAFGPQGK